MLDKYAGNDEDGAWQLMWPPNWRKDRDLEYHLS
jgi:hypothetical protein